MCVRARVNCCGNVYSAATDSIHNRSIDADVTDVPFLDEDDDCISRRFQTVKRKENTAKNYAVTFAAQFPSHHLNVRRELYANYRSFPSETEWHFNVHSFSTLYSMHAILLPTLTIVAVAAANFID